MVTMKWTIEKKILVPFVLLVLISLGITLGASFKNDYSFIINNQFRNMDESILQLEGSLKHLTDQGDGTEITDNRKAILIEQIRDMMRGKIVVIENRHILLNETDIELGVLKHIINSKIDSNHHIDAEDYLLSFRKSAYFGWSFALVENKGLLLETFYESYKYNFLTGIIFLTLSLQITVFLASNITKPIKKLVRFCMGIPKSERGQRIDLVRHDEIGQLSHAFNRMLDELDASVDELTQMKKYNDDILNSIEKGIITFDVGGNIISLNPCAQELLLQYENYRYMDYTLDELVQCLVHEYRHNMSSVSDIYAFSVDNDLKVCYLDINISTLRTEQGGESGYIFSMSDVTERKRLESYYHRLERLATAGRLASGVAHEIRNPLTGMRTSAQVLKKRLKGQLEEKNEAMIDRIIKEIDRINRLISDLLGYTRITKSQPASVYVKDCVESIFGLLGPDLENKHVHINTQAVSDFLSFHLDEDQFKQVLLNLIKNAVEAIGKDGGEISIETSLENSSTGQGALWIHDTGHGIEGKQLEKIFDPFYTTKNDGTGLGLSIVHELVQKNDGEINIRSVVGQGTSVQLIFNLGVGKYE